MAGTVEFDIDLYEPAGAVQGMKEHAHYAALNVPVKFLRNYRHYRSRNNSHCVGITYSKMFDWRDLECKHVWMRGLAAQWQAAEWDLLREQGSKAKELGMNEVWLPEKDGRYVTEYSVKDNSCHSNTLERIVEYGIKNPDYKGLTVSPDIVKEYDRLCERSSTWRRRSWAYTAAFQCAVEERIRTFRDSELMRKHSFRHAERAYCEPAVFVIENQGRSYVLELDENSCLKWRGGTAYVSRSKIEGQ